MSKQANNIPSLRDTAINAGRTLSAKIGDSATALTAFITAMNALDKDWTGRTKSDKSEKGLAVEAVRLDLQAREKERGARNPDDAWSKAKAEAKGAKVGKVKTSKVGASRTGKREPKRDADQIFGSVVLAYRAKVSSNTVKDKGANLTAFQRECAPLLAQMAELISKHKIKVTK